MGSRGPKAKPQIERLLRRVVKNEVSGCWDWMGCLNAGGYGHVGREGIGCDALTHRVAYTALVGPIPEGLVLDHLCRNRRCCNPEHLEPVTRSENLLRSGIVGKWNALKLACPKCGGPFSMNSRQRYCKSCSITYSRERKRRQPKQMLTCKSCGVEFVKNAGRPAKRCPTCR